MRIFTLTSTVIMAFVLPASAEVVQTIDGRSVDLKDDGTYEFIERIGPSSSDLVEFRKAYFEHHTGQYGQKFVRFMPVYKNISKKRIVGVKFTAQFLNSFGEEIFSFSGVSDEQVPPGKTSTHKLFYNFEDNQFISGEPYDKLMPMVTNKSENISVTLDMIAFEGGEVIKLSQ
ncbi:hypothetical protein OO012_13010 [Rhodobacteraceae bacterium KMM 6894]|nr:hypothetical protein [Rhodobacteraceae bacterium KMM 6894]